MLCIYVHIHRDRRRQLLGKLDDPLSFNSGRVFVPQTKAIKLNYIIRLSATAAAVVVDDARVPLTSHT